VTRLTSRLGASRLLNTLQTPRTRMMLRRKRSLVRDCARAGYNPSTSPRIRDRCVRPAFRSPQERRACRALGDQARVVPRYLCGSIGRSQARLSARRYRRGVRWGTPSVRRRLRSSRPI
jgi:hypothetical protein